VLAVDVLVALGVASLVALCVLGATALRRRDPRPRGEANARELRADRARRCRFCGRRVDPQVDLYDGGWFHECCYTNDPQDKES